MEDAEEKVKKPKNGLLVSVLASLGMGTGGGAMATYYVQEIHAKAIEKLEMRQDKIEDKIFTELKEMNTRMSTLEGYLKR